MSSKHVYNELDAPLALAVCIPPSQATQTQQLDPPGQQANQQRIHGPHLQENHISSHRFAPELPKPLRQSNIHFRIRPIHLENLSRHTQANPLLQPATRDHVRHARRDRPPQHVLRRMDSRAPNQTRTYRPHQRLHPHTRRQSARRPALEPIVDMVSCVPIVQEHGNAKFRCWLRWSAAESHHI